MIADNGIRIPAQSALLRPDIAQLQGLFPAVRLDDQAGGAYCTGFDAGRIAQRFSDLGLIHHPRAGKTEDGHLFPVDQLLLQQLDHRTAVAALDHNPDLFTAQSYNFV